MLRLLEQQENALIQFCEKDVFGTRISAYIMTYGTAYPFALFYLQEIDGVVAAAICRIDGAMTICCENNADFTELAEFIGAIGYESIICDAEVCKKLNMKPRKSGFVVEFNSETEKDHQKDISFANGFELTDIYAILKSADFDSLPALPQWISDVSNRVNLGTARAAAVEESGKPAACAMVLFSTGNAVLIGAVATAPECRGKGYARALVSMLARDERAANKRVELLCAKDGIIEFYNKLGFVKTGEWALI